MFLTVGIEINETFHAQYTLSVSLLGVKVNKKERTCHTVTLCVHFVYFLMRLLL